ncbi:glycogen/starch/alpha-glucan phosphorylase [Pseudomaricurvus sp. HS19]|uniref:glycogen/starch/alpha-glucan phosphorylase n=1 Tax=Pseudomaricurvus sp. HS19 TaxID=2692626 RepID=UPI0013715B47|nr:glycogen/starch/alpha-glucan phosphorylase [Pseudomaricurvus sp. HS19]MYM63323.1 glycogen/starch/alpha-glucan family phosphorylase [Pseudomaricurvus sp. HS19]
MGKSGKSPEKSSGKSAGKEWLGLDAKSFATDLDRHLNLTLGKDPVEGSHLYLYNAAALTIRDRLVERWRATRDKYATEKPKRVAYLSLEFLMGRTLTNAVLNLDMDEALRKALKDYGVTLEELAQEERDAGLGNGGLGRLAACFLDSCATLELPVTGYGIRYDYGMFHQKIKDGYQIELPDQWLKEGNPWEFEAPENIRRIKFHGHTETHADADGNLRVQWVDTDDVLAVPYDMPIPGYRNNTVNTLRLWKASATDEFKLDQFNQGSYTEAVAAKNEAEQISMVLYPNDVSENGKVLRLRQQYFLSSASLQDVIIRWRQRNGDTFEGFADKNCFQLNDTHPAIAVAELMRLLMDDYGMGWDEAWEITRSTMAYTNHTLLPEALERWPVRLFRDMLPRLLEIIYEINARFLRQVSSHWPHDEGKLRELSIIEEGGEPQVRMAYLAIVGSHSVNGVAALHTELLKSGLFKTFYELWPEKFNNKTNGVTPRRWLGFCNPQLASLINKTIGEGWLTDLDQLQQLKPLADDKAFQKKWMAVKKHNKTLLAEMVECACGVSFDTDMMFDVQVKRIHEYKRQLLNILHVIHLYDRIMRGDTEGMVPRCVLIGGKAAPGYFMAKLIIKLINSVAEVVNAEPLADKLLKVAFLPNYRVTAMEMICAGTDLSEQISTAGKEASGTGNMKFMMNGALTIGTLDGANIEIRDAVGEEDFFLFGLKADEVEQVRKSYDPDSIIESDSDLKSVMHLLESGHFNLCEPGIFNPIINTIRDPHDQWVTAADFRSFTDAQVAVGEVYQQKALWTRKSILNTASSGMFSSDRTIGQYADEIWRLKR